MLLEIPASPATKHFNERTKPISAIVIHDTMGKNAAGTLAWFADPASEASSHVVIDRDGSIYRCVPDRLRAWHAGKSSMFGEGGVNDFSLGVEIVDNDDSTPYPTAQMAAVVRWCARKSEEWGIPLNRIWSHEAVRLEYNLAHPATPAPPKHDPGRDFPWRRFLLGVAIETARQADG